MKLVKLPLTLVFALVTFSAGAAQAVPGPDPSDDVDWFTISVSETEEAPPPRDGYSSTRFNETLGWDFGDRVAYACAWVEFFQAGDELFEVHYELVKDYPVPTIINDRNGREVNGDRDIADLCGHGFYGAGIHHDRSDHFPHGTDLIFYRDGSEIARVRYPDRCTKGYWTPGNQPGEAWLWWDEDGPADKMMHGDGRCGGGPGEPVAVVRASVRNVASGIGYCARDEMDGGLCKGPTPQHPSSITLQLSGHIRASGHVGVPDGTTDCRANRTVVILRSVSGEWRRVGRDRTNAAGDYALHVRAREGRYRAWLQSRGLADGDVCMAATSRKVAFGLG